jgi:hypothetical protein
MLNDLLDDREVLIVDINKLFIIDVAIKSKQNSMDKHVHGTKPR